eukprot:3585794-Pyramimonas_sp.AAC.1
MLLDFVSIATILTLLIITSTSVGPKQWALALPTLQPLLHCVCMCACHVGDVLEAVLALCEPYAKKRLPVRGSFGQARGVTGLGFSWLHGH